MAFQIKDFTSIVASMINLMRGNTTKITDYQPGSVARTLVEAPAMEIEELYIRMFQGLLEAIPVATYTSFDFQLLGDSPSSGVMTFYSQEGNPDGVVVNAGTTIRNPTTNIDYQTTQELTIPAGQAEGSVSAIAVQTGFAGNTAANTITILVDDVDGVTGVANLTAFSGGRNFETEEERKVRFRDYIQTLQRGTLSAVRYGASTAYVRDVNNVIIERAVLIEVDEPYKRDPINNNPGFVIVYIHNGVGNTSLTLVAEVRKRLEGYDDDNGNPVAGYMSAGVDLEVYGAEEVDQNVTGEVVIKDGFEAAAVLAECVTAVREYLLSLSIGKEAVRQELVEQIMRVEGVYDLTLTVPAANTTPDFNQKIVPGVVAITEAV